MIYAEYLVMLVALSLIYIVLDIIIKRRIEWTRCLFAALSVAFAIVFKDRLDPKPGTIVLIVCLVFISNVFVPDLLKVRIKK